MDEERRLRNCSISIDACMAIRCTSTEELTLPISEKCIRFFRWIPQMRTVTPSLFFIFQSTGMWKISMWNFIMLLWAKDQLDECYQNRYRANSSYLLNCSNHWELAEGAFSITGKFDRHKIQGRTERSSYYYSNILENLFHKHMLVTQMHVYELLCTLCLSSMM